MGDIRKQRKKYDTPRFPWRGDTLQDELKFIGQYGLRNKHELWKHETALSNYRGIARALIGAEPEERKKREDEIVNKLKRIGILGETAVLDDVLDLTIEDLLERRFQTLVFRKGLAKSLYQCRQLITHGHIAIDNRRVTVPSYIVTKKEESQIAYYPKSPLANPTHAIRQMISSVPTTGGAPAGQETEKRL